VRDVDHYWRCCRLSAGAKEETWGYTLLPVGLRLFARVGSQDAQQEFGQHWPESSSKAAKQRPYSRKGRLLQVLESG
jgi:hypothetical protein